MNSQVYVRCRPLVVRKFHISSVVSTEKCSSLIDSIIRVDHAGELGADRIYAGQMAILGNTKMGPLIQHMWDQEKVHKAAFENLIVKYRVRPTAFVPIWNVAGFLLGAGTALMGEKAAMACTVAVESVIVDHYNDQLRTLMADPEKNKELMETIQKFRDDEQEHHDTGIDHGAEQAPFYKALSEVIKFGCKTAITISKGSIPRRTINNKITTCRLYSTLSGATSQPKWDLYSAVCLERKPITVKPFNELEKKVVELLRKQELERSHKSDHEIKAEEELKRSEEIKKNPKSLDFDVILEQTASEFETASEKELEAFLTSTSITTDDLKNDVKSLNRKLDKHLLFLVKEKLNNNNKWLLPGGVRKGSETMRETAERILREKCGEKLNVLFLGNAPCGFYKYRYSKKWKNDSVGAKIFFFKALYVSGPVELKTDDCSDYQWATRIDLEKLLEKPYLRKVKRFLIDDDDDDVNSNDADISELGEKRGSRLKIKA